LAACLHQNPVRHGKAYNFGPLPEDHLTVRQLVESAIQHWGSGNWQHLENFSQPHEAGLLKLDISLAKQELRWEPKLNADTAVKWTMDWYKKPVKEQANFALQQIREYFSL
jgi:CDP-glucose 4,6-dehydratase